MVVHSFEQLDEQLAMVLAERFFVEWEVVRLQGQKKRLHQAVFSFDLLLLNDLCCPFQNHVFIIFDS